MDEKRYPLLTASALKYALPEVYGGAVVLWDDRREILQALQSKDPMCRFLMPLDCYNYSV